MTTEETRPATATSRVPNDRQAGDETHCRVQGNASLRQVERDEHEHEQACRVARQCDHRRARAARRLPPLARAAEEPDGWRRADPDMVHLRAWWRAARPSHYSLSPQELHAEALRCRRDGWQPWEVRQVLARSDRPDARPGGRSCE